MYSLKQTEMDLIYLWLSTPHLILSLQDVYRQLSARHAALRGMSVQDAKCCFVKLWSTLPLFGLELLSCVNVATREKGIVGISKRKVCHTLNSPHYVYLCLKHVPFKMRSGRSRNYLFLLRSSVLCRSYFCPITGRSPCHGILRTSWLMSRWVYYLFVFVMLLSGLQSTHHSSPLKVACTIQ